MSANETKPRRWKRQLLNKYRIVIVNDKTFEDVRSYRLNLLNGFTFSLVLIFLFILSTVLLLVVTPIKQYIPGYSSSDLKQQAVSLTLKVDSLEANARANEIYISSIKRVLMGDLEVTRESIDSLRLTEKPINQIEHKEPSEKDLQLREMVRLEDKYNLFPEAAPKVSFVLFSPISGEIISKFDPSRYRFGTEFIASKNTAIKSVADGIVLLVDWTIRDGFTVIVSHEEGLISVYKHLTSTTKSAYEKVKSGEVLGLFDGGATEKGNDQSTTYFYFELWKDIYPLDPSVFIDFE